MYFDDFIEGNSILTPEKKITTDDLDAFIHTMSSIKIRIRSSAQWENIFFRGNTSNEIIYTSRP